MSVISHKHKDFDSHSETILLALQDQELIELIENRLQYFNYATVHANNSNQLKKKISLFKPKILIIDMNFQSHHFGLKLAQSVANNSLSIIFLSNEDTLKTRILCAQNAGNAFLPLPLSIDLLCNYIHELTTKINEKPYRILIIEDVAPQAFFIASILKQAKMNCKIIQNPNQLLSTLSLFNPELILLDLYLPYFSGFDLAQIIRQQNNYIAVPIVFLSSEKNQQQQLQALTLGSDDFLTKPIAPNHLLSTVSARVSRFRKMRYFIQHDSLTHLLNHSSFLSELKSAQKQSRETRLPLSFSMLDIDNFKQINDSHGHLIGDHVLKNLAYLLKNRFRNTDLIGRYGGEEFSIVLHNSTPNEHFTIINHVRDLFSKIAHYALDKSFHCSFSAGICDIQPHHSIKEIITSADKALYQAKKNGKNCCYVMPSLSRKACD